MTDNAGDKRLLSLDIFRGITIASMILVNNPGTWSAVYPPLRHAEWHGATPTDFIFPFFLFIVGIAIPLALGKRIEQTAGKDVYVKIFRRSALIFLIGLFLNLIFSFDFANLRILGVLQRIAICYLIASIMFLNLDWRKLLGASIGLLFLYWGMMTLVLVPGCEMATVDDKACNLAAYFDRMILGENHIWKYGKVFDPEGILSTIPAIVTTVSGVLTGMWLRSSRGEMEKAGGIFFAGVVLTASGWFWGLFFPINKSLWTSSYVLYTSGLALSLLGVCYWLADIKNYRRWSKPFVVFGVNALALYVFSVLLTKTLIFIKVSGEEGKHVTIYGWIYKNVFLPFAEPVNASLMFAVSYVLFCLALMWMLYRKKIYIKV